MFFIRIEHNCIIERVICWTDNTGQVQFCCNRRQSLCKQRLFFFQHVWRGFPAASTQTSVTSENHQMYLQKMYRAMRRTHCVYQARPLAVPNHVISRDATTKISVCGPTGPSHPSIGYLSLFYLYVLGSPVTELTEWEDTDCHQHCLIHPTVPFDVWSAGVFNAGCTTTAESGQSSNFRQYLTLSCAVLANKLTLR